MKYFVEFVVSALVDKPDEVLIDDEEERGRTHYRVQVNPGDVGKVIGKKGRTIRAIRNVVNAVARHRKQSVQVDIRDR
ncbi:MAG: KH domain-containing protein [Verrucomicrobiota bacterium]